MTIVNSPAIFVVSVKSFIDRHRSIEMQAKKNGLLFEYIWTFDANELTETDLGRCNVSQLPIKSISTVLKHVEAQFRLVRSNREWCLVLEDDALFAADFSARYDELSNLIAEISEPCLVFLGGTDNKLDSRFYSGGSLKLIESPLTTAEAYLFNRSSAELRANWLDSNLIDGPADHFLKSLDQRLGIRHYRVSHPFVSQGSITGQFKTTLDSSRAKHGKLYLRLRFEFNRFRKQTLPRWLYSIKAIFF